MTAVTLTPIPHITIEDDPTVVAGPDGFDVVLSPDAALLPQRFVDALTRIAFDGFDNAACAACGDPVGFRLHGDADEQTTWHPLVLSTLDLADPAEAVEASCPVCSADALASQDWPKPTPAS